MHALSRVFRGKFVQAVAAGVLPRDPTDTEPARRQRVQALRRHNWVVYAKTPLGGPTAVLDYLDAAPPSDAACVGVARSRR